MLFERGQLHIPRHAVVLLRPSTQAQERGYVRLDLRTTAHEPNSWILPLINELFFFLEAPNTGATLSFNPADMIVESISRPLAAYIRCRRIVKKNLRLGTLNFDGIRIIPAGPEKEYKNYCKRMRFLRFSGSQHNGQIMRDHPEVITGWPPEPKKSVRTHATTPRIAVALHLYYTDLWPEIEILLGRWTSPFKLFLTLTKENQELTARVAAVFPGSVIRIVENFGRDVRPFLMLLEDGSFDEFDFVCKIHGKKSISHGRVPIFGDIWRRATFLDLIATNQQVLTIVNLFQDNTQIGIIGPRRFLATSTPTAPRDLLGKNRQIVDTIATRMGRPIQKDAFDFFEGTMFWARPQALAPLRALHLSLDFTPAHSSYDDGGVEHAVERLFNYAARVAGFDVMAVSGENHRGKD
ncbi:rhamnan synthesis F family protein [Acidocella sp.]|uniref:rhamnan synthesis F family protein n=1 Tax=Acidocella sp. TaxID=50710 RepID=UPI001798D630|nr:rhamnan synthesis F family protein [Acidocella sp.]NNM57957.1 hypothetical protein [Acidocella sp.]